MAKFEIRILDNEGKADKIPLVRRGSLTARRALLPLA